MHEELSVPVIIPAFEPDDRLLQLLYKLDRIKAGPVILVNDGSTEKSSSCFETAEKKYHCVVLKHEQLKGRGRSLKDAFRYCLDNFPGIKGCVTAEYDGRYTAESILEVKNTLLANPDCMVMGSRELDASNCTRGSLAANKILCIICHYTCGIDVKDIMTGLRGIPAGYMSELLSVKGERYDFETRMLIGTKNKYNICEVANRPESMIVQQADGYYRKYRDSFWATYLLWETFIKYSAISVSAAIIDMILFMFFCAHFDDAGGYYYVAAATVLARVISATFNYLGNYLIAFKSKESHGIAVLKFAGLSIIQMGASAGLVTLGVVIFSHAARLAVKIIVDTVLFFVNYRIQHEYIYNDFHQKQRKS